MNGVLFIGGPADGRREVVESLLPVRAVREIDPIPFLRPWESAPTTLEFTEHHYLLRRLDSDAYVYLHESIHQCQLVYKLLAGYNPIKPA